MPVRRTPFLVAFLVLASGCAGDPSGTGDAASTTSAPGGQVAGGPGNGTSPPTAPVLRTVDLYLTAEGGLSLQKPAAGAVASPFTGAQLATGIVPMEFKGGALPAAVAIPTQVVRAHLWVEGGAGLVSNTALDIGVFFGATRGMPLSDFGTYPAPVTAPGTPLGLVLELDVGDMLPIVVPAGDALRAMLVVGGDYASGGARVLVGGENASRFNLTYEELPSDPLVGARPVTTPLSGALQAGPGAMECTPAPDSTRVVPFDVPANATYVQVRVAGTAAGGATDLDLTLRSGERLVAASVTPLADEGIFLAGPGLREVAGKSLDLTIRVCSGTQVTYDGSVVVA